MMNKFRGIAVFFCSIVAWSIVSFNGLSSRIFIESGFGDYNVEGIQKNVDYDRTLLTEKSLVVHSNNNNNNNNNIVVTTTTTTTTDGEDVRIFTDYYSPSKALSSRPSPQANNNSNNNDISIVTQFSIDRWDNFIFLANQWKGYMTCAIYIKGPEEKAELDRLLALQENKAVLSKVHIHVYYYVISNSGDDKKQDDYPINRLRNVALDNTYTDYVLLLDVDFVPSNNAETELQTLFAKTDLKDRLQNKKEVLVLPAFEFFNKENTRLPLTKSTLLTSIRAEESRPFHTKDIKSKGGGHGPTNFERWYKMTAKHITYPIRTPNKSALWKYNFEPYIVAYRKALPRFWDGFVGYGKNKSSFFLELEFMNFKFSVAPQTFVIHKNHQYEHGIINHKERKFQTDLKKEYDEKFVPYLQNKYQSSPLIGAQRKGSVTAVSRASSDEHRCAIIFWGLPRAFDTLVLPSVTQNVIIPNAKYNCDYYAHYYHATEELGGRAGAGGKMNPNAIRALKPVVLKAQSKQDPIVEFKSETEKDFMRKYRPLVKKIRTTIGPDGNYYYFPWKAKTYRRPLTTNNILKMWHSIQSGWELMEASGKQYDQVAMLRSDVFYVTPIDIYENPNALTNDDGKPTEEKSIISKNPAVIPNFGNWPISDRMIYGPYNAVKIWATGRFNKLEEHVAWAYKHDNGFAMHSERFMNHTVFPAIQETGGTMVARHPTMCFLRARVDGTIWITDCGVHESEVEPRQQIVWDPRILENLGGNLEGIKQVVEKILGYKCGNVAPSPVKFTKIIDCSQPARRPQGKLKATV